jgi:hypothetical protein
MAVESLFNVKVQDSQQILRFFDSMAKKTEGLYNELRNISEEGSLTAQVGGTTQEQTLFDRRMDNLKVALETGRAKLVELRREMTSTQDEEVFDRAMGEARQYARLIEEVEFRLEGLSEAAGSYEEPDFGGDFGGGSFAQARIGGALSSFGQFGAGDIAMTGGDVSELLSDVSAEFSNMNGALGSLGRVGNFAAKGVGFVSVALAGLRTGADLFDQMIGRSAEERQAQLRDIMSDAERETDIRKLVREGDVEGLEALIESSEDFIGMTTDVRDNTIASAVETTSSYDQLRTVSGHLIGNIEVLGITINDSSKVYGDAASQIADANRDLNQSTESINEYSLALAGARIRQREIQAAERLKEAEEELVDIRTQAASVYADYTEQFDDALENETFQRGRELEDRLRADSQAHERLMSDLAQIQLEGAERILDIKSEGLERLAELETDYFKAIDDAYEELQKNLAETNLELEESLSDERSDFMESEIETLEDHLRDLERADEQSKRDRLRRLEDLNDELFEAELSNSVDQFILAQRNAEKDLRRAAEDKTTEEQQASEDFIREQQERREEHRQRISDIRQQAADSRAELILNYEQEREERAEAYAESQIELQAALEERILTEKEAIAESQAALQENYEKQREAEDEERRFRDERRREDFRREMEQLQEQTNDQLMELENREAALSEIVQNQGFIREGIVRDNESQITDIMVSEYRARLGALERASSSATDPLSRRGGRGSGETVRREIDEGLRARPGRPGILAADGFIAGPHDPRMVIMGEGSRPELVLPLEQSQGVGGINGLGNSYSVSIGDVSVGEGVSADFVKIQLEILGKTVVGAISEATVVAPTGGH